MSKSLGQDDRKKVYLLGVDNGGQHIFMESPTFDCSWYWGFGYIEEYTNNENPHKSHDITSHSHFKGGLVGNIDKEYIHHINKNKTFKSTVLTDSESWLLSELMESARILSESAALFHTGGAHVTTNTIKTLKNIENWYNINYRLLPEIFSEIDKLLSPDKDDISAELEFQTKKVTKAYHDGGVKQ